MERCAVVGTGFACLIRGINEFKRIITVHSPKPRELQWNLIAKFIKAGGANVVCVPGTSAAEGFLAAGVNGAENG
jgi:hypothetical protein